MLNMTVKDLFAEDVPCDGIGLGADERVGGDNQEQGGDDDLGVITLGVNEVNCCVVRVGVRNGWISTAICATKS